MDLEIKRFTLSARVKGVATTLILIAIAATAIVWPSNPERVWANLLLNNFYFTAVALAGALFVSIQYLSKAGWATVLRRVPEAMMAYLPVAAFFMLIFFIFAVVLNQHPIYHWANPEALLDSILAKKSGYLNTGFFVTRMLLILALWIGLAYFLRKESFAQDKSASGELSNRAMIISAIFVPVFAITLSLASFDWLMSIEAHWFSTIFGVYNFAGLFQNGMVVTTLIVLFLMKTGYFKGLVNENHLHDLGKLIFAFSVFWAYIWLSQYLLIWYANIPEESIYYVLRHDARHFPLFLLNLGINWVFPFLALMPRANKRSPKILGSVCLVLLVGRWLDLYLMITPSLNQGYVAVPIGVFELVMSLGFAGLFALITGWALSRAPLVPNRDPYLAESLHHHQ